MKHKSNFTPSPWKIHRGFSDWGLPCQHDIYVGEEGKEDQIAGIPSLTPYCMGASAKDKDLAARRWADTCLIVTAPELYEALSDSLRWLKGVLDCYGAEELGESKPVNCMGLDEIESVLKKALGK